MATTAEEVWRLLGELIEAQKETDAQTTAKDTRDAPTDVFALRPAPIQVNYKGYPGTIGGSFIDYIVADEFVIPPEQRDCYSEQVVYLPETYWVDDSRRTLPGTPPDREKLGLPSRGTVFC